MATPGQCPPTLRGLARQWLAMGLAVLLAGTAMHWRYGRRLPWDTRPAAETQADREPREGAEEGRVRELTRAELGQMFQTGDVLWIDAREAVDFERVHVRGAIHLPAWQERDIRLKLAGVPKSQVVVVYCREATCSRAAEAAAALCEAGFTRAHVYAPGWDDLAHWVDLEFEGTDVEH